MKTYTESLLMTLKTLEVKGKRKKESLLAIRQKSQIVEQHRMKCRSYNLQVVINEIIIQKEHKTKNSETLICARFTAPQSENES